jgi:hypothetical protein
MPVDPNSLNANHPCPVCAAGGGTANTIRMIDFGRQVFECERRLGSTVSFVIHQFSQLQALPSPLLPAPLQALPTPAKAPAPAPVKQGDPCPLCPGEEVLSVGVSSFGCGHPVVGGWFVSMSHSFDDLVVHGNSHATYALAEPRKGYGPIVWNGIKPSPPRLDARHYPHTCPRCGGKAYIGTSTDHMDTSRNGTCR